MAIRSVKEEIRILGVDDAARTAKDERVLLVGTVFRAGSYLDGVLSEHITADGDDSTEKIIDLFAKTGNKDQIRVIMLNGITFGGFNVADIRQISERTKTPVIAVMRDKPDPDSIKRALEHFPDGEKRWKLHQKAGGVSSVRLLSGKTVYFQSAGLPEPQAALIIKKTCTHSKYPEPLRIAHIIGAGILLGRSKKGK